MKAETKQLMGAYELTNVGIVDAPQGSPEWHANRDKSYNASELARAMGIDPNGRQRSGLVRRYATGICDPEFTDYVKTHIIEPGHEIEAAAREIISARIGEELYPRVFFGDLNGLRISASLDGINIDDSKSFECKRKNKDLWEAVSSGVVPEAYRPQLEQGLMLSRADVCLFTVSDGTNDGTIYCEYRSDPALRAMIEPTWRQFADDVANYQHVETAAEAVGATVEALPAPVLLVEGRVVASNMDAFKLAAGKFLDRLPKADALETDQDFADADKAVKACEDAEDRLKLVKAQAQAQAVDIDEVFRAMDQIGAQIRDARLALTKAVTKRKDNIREGLVVDANKQLAEHIKKLNDRLGGEWMPVINGEFQAAIKGKKTLSGLREAIGNAMAQAKIKANEIADTIESNRKRLIFIDNQNRQEDLIGLFPDWRSVCTKAPDDFSAMLGLRVIQHNERLEAERERIRQQETEKLAKAEQDQRGKASTEDVKPVPDTRTADAPWAVSREDEGTQVGKTSTPPDNGKTMKLGDICARLGFTVSADFLAGIGYPVHATEKNAKLYRECDFHGICAAIIRHLQTVSTQQGATK